LGLIQNRVSSRSNEALLFITWAEDCSRSDSIAKRLGGISLMVYSPFWGSRYSTVFFKYLSQSFKTLKALFRHRPRVVLVMTPPVFACIPVWIYSKFTRARHIIDAHSGAFLDRRWTSILFLHKFFSRHAALTLVTSPFCAELVSGWGANTKIVSDVPVCFEEPRHPKLGGRMNMTFIGTFTRDEPLMEFLSAASQFQDIQFYVTGRLKDASPDVLNAAPKNVVFTDFLSNADYVGLLLASDAVICLTTEDHTMQRGAYEAVYLGKPVITSNFDLLRKSFHAGTIHVGNSPEEIALGIREMKQDLRKYQREVQQLRAEKLQRWDKVEQDLKCFFEMDRSLQS